MRMDNSMAIKMEDSIFSKDKSEGSPNSMGSGNRDTEEVSHKDPTTI